jgi:hypothetical protein
MTASNTPRRIGNFGGVNSGKAAYITMTCETPIICAWMNGGDMTWHNINARMFTNTYIDNLIKSMCRELVKGTFGEPNS